MVRMLGDKVNVEFHTIQEELTLFLDITNQDWDVIRNLDPELTYIVTRKPFGRCEEYVALGFYNIIFDVEPKTITKGFLTRFMNTQYLDNKMKIVHDNLLPLYEKFGTEVDCIEQLLSSIKYFDADKFESLVKFNMDTMIQSMSQIKTMSILAKSLGDDAKDIKQMQEDTARAQAVIKQVELLKESLGESKVREEDLKSDLRDLQEQNQALKDELARQNAEKISEIADKTDKFRTMELELSKVRAEYSALEEAHNKLQVTASVFDSEGGEFKDPKDRLIANLKKEITALRETSYIDSLKAKLPTVTDSVNLNASKIVYFKEVKPQIYINSMVAWIEMYLKIKFQGQDKSALILVFDQLSNEAVIQKYTKRGWAINTAPKPGSKVVITNEVSLGFLKGRLRIDQYSLLIVVDRLGNFKDVFDSKKLSKWYMITTVNDVHDFKLDRDRCIGFFDQKPGEFVRFNISPSDENLTRSDTEKRAYKILKDGVYKTILMEAGGISDD